MKKKYLRPVPKTVDNETKTDASAETKRRKLSGKKIFLIVMIVIAVCTAVVVPVCVVYTDVPVKPTFMAFDQNGSYSITATWNKVTAVDHYEVQYCHADPNLPTTVITEGSTVNNRYPMERYAGSLYFRVRAVKKGRKGAFSDWIRKDIEAWQLPAPVIKTKLTGEAYVETSWTTVNFRYNDSDLRSVYAYAYEYCWQKEGEEPVWMTGKTFTTSITISLPTEYSSYYAGLIDLWQGDVTFRIRVKALNYSLNTLSLTKFVMDSEESRALNHIYAETGDYGEESYTITEEMVKSIM